ncbi:hypothetical protein VPNG_08870 [Cytospora leucostoma]|uniref:Uncharacterized protein n=1 Tax=Cytospora leucostoma TaxID=1230097 RepID=A0A423VRH2_9PEZI|nr:hypothetical protein VPNG_08870 [Cytospora leucostoma]
MRFNTATAFTLLALASCALGLITPPMAARDSLEVRTDGSGLAFKRTIATREEDDPDSEDED